jgi:PadR family transcriptional regulator PadR
MVPMAGISSESLRGHLENLLLAALEAGEAHGFELLKRLTEAGSGALHLREGSVYPALYRLEAAGLVKSRWESPEEAKQTILPRRGPRKKLYRLTRKGTRRLAEGRAEWRQFVNVVGAILGA